MAGLERHSNGLIMPRPEGFASQETPEGFSVKEEGMLRNPEEYGIVLRVSGSKGEVPPPGYFGLFGPRELVTSDIEGGSGGIAYRLEAWRPFGTCWLVAHALSISETGEPSFLVARAALAKSSVRDDAGCDATATGK